MILHIFNGDVARNAWKKNGGSSPALAWRENYLEGRIPSSAEPLARFAEIRAKELHQSLPSLSAEKILRSLRHMQESVASLGAEDTAYLWFDACMFDQIMLARILFLLRRSRTRLFLICEDTAWGADPALFAERLREAPLLADATREAYAEAWEAFSHGAGAAGAFASDARLAELPFLRKAMRRYGEEAPDADGLGRSERQLVGIVRSGTLDFDGIFRAFLACEEYPFMGDTMCRRMLESLAARGLLPRGAAE